MKIIKGIISPIRSILVYIVTALILTILLTFIGGCSAIFDNKDSISELSFTPDGKKVVFDRCRSKGCQIQVYNLETGELAAYQSPKNEQWTMGRYSYDGKRIAFSVKPLKDNGERDLGNMQIAVMDADGKNLKKVTTGPGAKLYPAFSHNGKKILYACAAYIREKGGTLADNYDAWEVNFETGEQTRLTFFEYFYMGNLNYFPDDEKFIYYGYRPGVYEGLKSYPDEKAFGRKMVELEREGRGIHGVVVMKGRELMPRVYVFGKGNRASKPLLSGDGSMLIFEFDTIAGCATGGKFYLYSEDGKHRLVGNGGSVESAAISPDGKLFGVISAGWIIQIFHVNDGSLYKCLALPENIPNRDYGPMRNKINKILTEQPKYILNH